MSCNTRRDSVISGTFEVTVFTGECSKRKQAAQINSLDFAGVESNRALVVVTGCGGFPYWLSVKTKACPRVITRAD